jgi:hypothetical protein
VFAWRWKYESEYEPLTSVEHQRQIQLPKDNMRARRSKTLQLQVARDERGEVIAGIQVSKISS